MWDQFEPIDSQVPLTSDFLLLLGLQVEKKAGIFDSALPELTFVQNDIASDKVVGFYFLVFQGNLFSRH
jgi:hypothetical protein